MLESSYFTRGVRAVGGSGHAAADVDGALPQNDVPHIQSRVVSASYPVVDDGLVQEEGGGA